MTGSVIDIRNATTSLPGWQAWVLFFLLVLASSRFVAIALWNGQPVEVELYRAATLAFNYFEFGAIRRGLSGSLVHLISENTLVATIVFHFMAASAVAATAVLLLSRAAGTSERRGVLALTLLMLMLRWGDDALAGRPDMAVALMFCCTTVAFQRNRPALGTAFVAIGLLAHETSFTFGVPLLAGLTMQAGGWSALPRHERFAGAAVLTSALIVYFGMSWLPRADVHIMVATVRAKFVAHEQVEWAMYFALSGLRGVQTSICQNFTDPSYWVHPISGLIVIGLFGLALLPNDLRAWCGALLATLPGFLFLAVVANDAARWTILACFNIWLLAVSSREAPFAAGAHVARRLGLAAILFPLVLLRLPSTIHLSIYAPSPVLERVVRALGGPRTPSVAEALERCDPTWPDVLNRP